MIRCWGLQFVQRAVGWEKKPEEGWVLELLVVVAGLGLRKVVAGEDCWRMCLQFLVEVR